MLVWINAEMISSNRALEGSILGSFLIMKNERPEKSVIRDSVKLINLVLGVVVIVFWIFWHVGYAMAVAMSWMFAVAGAGSAPGGPVSEASVDAFSLGLTIGVIVSALAGFPAGLAVMRPRGERKSMFLLFLGMLASGLLIQIGSFAFLGSN